MSVEALSIALNLDVGDPTRKLMLLGYANHAHHDGTHIWASVALVAKYAGCSKRTVQRHLTVLLDEGYLREGDQGLLDEKKYPEHSRPIVYEMAMDDDTRLRWVADRRPGLRDAASLAGATGPAARKAGGKMTPGGGDDQSPGPGDADAAPPVTPESHPVGDTPVTQTVLEPSTQPSMKTADESAALPGMPEPDAKPVDTSPTTQEIAEEIAKGFHTWYAAEVGPSPTWRHVALRNTIVKALEAGFTRAQVGHALQALRRPLPTASAWEDTLQAIRAGRPISVQGGRVVASNVQRSPEMIPTHAARAADWG